MLVVKKLLALLVVAGFLAATLVGCGGTTPAAKGGAGAGSTGSTAK
jgi:hypothetical protein